MKSKVRCDANNYEPNYCPANDNYTSNYKLISRRMGPLLPNSLGSHRSYQLGQPWLNVRIKKISILTTIVFVCTF